MSSASDTSESRRETEPRVALRNDPALWQLVVEDYVAHGRRAWDPGFQALLVHRLGVARMNVGPRALRAPLSVVYRFLARTVSSVYGIELPYTARVGRRVIFEHQHGIVIHGASVIGDDCIIRHGVTLGMRRMDDAHAAPVLGDRVNVGAGAKLIGRIHVGDGAEIGANAVVLHDVPAGRLAVGIPARVVDRRDAAPPRDGARLRVTDIATKRWTR